ncbi:MAG: acetolactate synthase large subunit, partial [Chloroflexi bacterium]|nr:acetolactate synthase large subunit [Chloroflexota bacterium]
MRLTGAQILCETLVKEGVEVVFGFPGGVVLPLYDTLPQYPQLRHILVRHEQGAAHAADGYARATGKVGVCFATSGPGATNLVTGIANAYMDSIPMVAITGQVARPFIGKDAFQETDITGITLPITKFNHLVHETSSLARTLKEAFHVARTGRPGPVLLDIPRDVFVDQAEFYYPTRVNLPGYKPTLQGHPTQIKKAAKLINEAR